LVGEERPPGRPLSLTPITLHADPPLASKSKLCLTVVRQALIDARPADETWVVRMVGADQEVTRFEFRLDTEAPKAFAMAALTRLGGTSSDLTCHAPT
jgi:hypothetical protein